MWRGAGAVEWERPGVFEHLKLICMRTTMGGSNVATASDMRPKERQPDLKTYEGRFAARLAKLRELTGLTVADAAVRLTVQCRKASGNDDIQITRHTVYRWECGDTSPHVGWLPSIAKVYGVTVRELLPEK